MSCRAAYMLVIIYHSFPLVSLCKAYTRAVSHLLILSLSSVSLRPVTVLYYYTYLSLMNLAFQKRAHPSEVLVLVI